MCRGRLRMGLRINTNMSSVRALRSLTETTNDQKKAVQRLSSGKRVNFAAMMLLGWQFLRN